MTTGQQGAPRCLIAVGDNLLANFVDVLLNHGEYERERARTFAEAVDRMRAWRPHLAIVQLDFDDQRGAELINQDVPDWPVPVIILAARGGMRTKLDAFERGADDVLSIPFPPEELVARALSLVKRRHGITVRFRPSIQLGHLELDILAQRVRVDGREVALTAREDSLLYVLAAAAGRSSELADGLTTVARLLREGLPALERAAGRAATAFAYVGRMYVIGRGVEFATAREIALKLTETCRVAAEPLTATDFVHGPIAAVDPLFPVWTIATRDASLQAVREAAARVKEAGATIVASGDAADEIDGAAFRLLGPAAPQPLLSPLLSIVAGQLFAATLARAKGLDPDRPQRLTKVTLAR